MDLQPGKITNQYLSQVESWEETDVFNYQKKIKAQLSAPWFRAIFLFGLYSVITAGTWLVNMILEMVGFGYIFDVLSTTLSSILFLLGYSLTSVMLGLLDARRKNEKFVIDNRGEVGHHGRPYSRKLAKNSFASIIIFAAVTAGLLLFDLIYIEFDFSKLFTMDLLGLFASLIAASVYPFVYHLRAVAVLREFESDTCPVCSRSNFRMVKRAVNKGEDTVLSKQFAYTPGKIAYVYGQFIIDETMDRRETDTNCYITYCRYCSFYVKGNGVETVDE